MALGRRNGIHVGSRQAGPQSLTLSRILDEMHRNPDWGINEAVLSCQNRYKYLIALLKTNPEQLCISNFFPHPEVEVNTTLLVRLTLSKGCDHREIIMEIYPEAGLSPCATVDSAGYFLTLRGYPRKNGNCHRTRYVFNGINDGTPGGGSSFWTPDEAMESKDEAFHLREEEFDLHH